MIRAQATASRAPEWFSLAPIDAVRKVVAKAGWSLDSVDLFELNEAFSVQALAVIRELGLDQARVNVNGGAVALGHPIGASGAAVLVKLIYAMADRGAKGGLHHCVWGAEVRWRWQWNSPDDYRSPPSTSLPVETLRKLGHFLCHSHISPRSLQVISTNSLHLSQ